ncbi:MAG: radical SAM protein [Clostridia bacterium]|nr:radical SAM protein [Clostridia bacterium]
MKTMYNKVYVEITNICNMSCSFCHGHSRTPKRMSRDEFELILTKLTGYTKYIYYHLMGEPLTHPDIHEFISLAGERGYKSVITTNGTLLPRRGDDLIAAGVHKVNISLHSFENGSGGEHEKYVCGLADFAEKAAQNGVIVVFRLWNKGFDEGRNKTTLDILKENIEGCWKSNTRGLKIRERIFLEWGERFTWPDRDAEIQGTRFFCYGLKDQFGILSDGTVVPCCLDSEGVISLGNIFSGDIEDILSSQRARKIVEGFACGKASEDLCRRCGYAQRFV